MLIKEYIGEYGIEVSTFIPYIYYLKINNKLNFKIKIYDGMKSYYYFLDEEDIIYKNEKRYWIRPEFRKFLPIDLQNEDKIFSDLNYKLPIYFKPPNFYEYYKKYKIKFSKPFIIINNKYNSEWGENPRNYFDINELEYIINIFKNEYILIYIRSNDLKLHGYSYDHNEEESFHLYEKELIKKNYSQNVILYEDLLENYKNDYDFNTLKCILLANSVASISTIGGFNFFNSYFPHIHLIYRKNTPDLYNKLFYQNMHNILCEKSKEILFAENKNELYENVKQLKKYLELDNIK